MDEKKAQALGKLAVRCCTQESVSESGVSAPVCQATAVRVQEVTTFAEIKTLAPEWTALWKRCGSATPFQTPEWLLPWWHLFGRPRLWLLAVHADSELVGLAPLFAVEDRSQRVVRLLGTGISDYMDFLIAPGFSSVVLESIFDFLGKNRGVWDICDFENVPAEAPMLAMNVPPGFHLRHMSSAKCPVLTLPKTGKDWFQQLSHNTRRALMRSRAALATEGACFEKAMPENLEEYLQAVFRLHAMAWQHRGQPGVLVHPVAQQFCRAAASNLMRLGAFHFFGLRIHGSLSAVLLCFSNARRMFAYLSGYDPAFSYCSPGTALLAYAIEESIQNRFEAFDFLRGNESYKYRWGAHDTESRRMLLW